jgi:hypothetical protein
MSEPAILAVGTRDRWRGIQVSHDGVPEVLGVFLLRLLRRYGGLKAVAEKFVASPTGWVNLPMREASKHARWFTQDDPDSRAAFLTWFILDVEGGRLEVFDVKQRQWLEAVQVAPDGRLLNRPAWVLAPPPWLPTRLAQVDAFAARILEGLRQHDLPVERARAIVSAWMRSLVPQAPKGDWELWRAEDATCWSAWRLDGQLLWIPDRVHGPGFRAHGSSFTVVFSTGDCGVGFGTSNPARWLPAVEQAGVPRAKAARTLEALFAAAATPWAKHPVRVAVEGIFHQEPSGPLEALKQKLFKPKPELLPAPDVVEVLPAMPYEELGQLLQRGEIPWNVVQDAEGFHPARTLGLPREWFVHLLQALCVPVARGSYAVPERRRARFWPYEEP